jgi:hypothetical protein
VSGFRPVCHAAHGPHMDPPRIPLAEDHAGSLEQLRRLVEAEFERSPRSGIGPDVVVTDIRMPGRRDHRDRGASGSTSGNACHGPWRSRAYRGGLVWAIKALMTS